MINLKTPQEIKIMHEGGVILKKAVQLVLPHIVPGITTYEIDQKAEKLLKEYGATPSFQTVKGYRWATCLPVNEQAVHTPPSKRVLQSGDILTLDIGALYKGFHTDYAVTLPVGKVASETMRFLEVGKNTLAQAVAKLQNGVYLGTISQHVQQQIEKNGYFILKDLTGHGIGRSLHEDPYVLNYLDRPIEKTYRVGPGFVAAIEIIYSMGSEKISYEAGDTWSIISADRSLSACFEVTIAVTDKKTFILT